METIKFLIDFVLHIDKHLGELMMQHGPWWMYGIIFLIIFIETGVVFMPFLPGDSLLFASGALWAATGNNIFLLLFLCVSAAVIGDNCNYFIGRNFSDYLKSKAWFKKFVSDENIKDAENFVAKHGGKSIFLARFFPIIRTIVPFIVGAGKMKYSKFRIIDFLKSSTRKEDLLLTEDEVKILWQTRRKLEDVSEPTIGVLNHLRKHESNADYIAEMKKFIRD